MISDSQRLILKTWLENEEPKFKIFDDLKNAIKKKEKKEKYFLIKEIDNIDCLRGIKDDG